MSRVTYLTSVNITELSATINSWFTCTVIILIWDTYYLCTQLFSLFFQCFLFFILLTLIWCSRLDSWVKYLSAFLNWSAGSTMSMILLYINTANRLRYSIFTTFASLPKNECSHQMLSNKKTIATFKTHNQLWKTMGVNNLNSYSTLRMSV